MVSGLWITVLLGVFFLIAQFMGFASLVGNKIFMVDKTSSSNQYFYVLIFIHAVHLIGGTLALVILLLKAIRFRIHAGNTEGLELAAIFWHFLDGLWVYLFIFMNIYFT
jgi:cytochrome c oxidase subunit 3